MLFTARRSAVRRYVVVSRPAVCLKQLD